MTAAPHAEKTDLRQGHASPGRGITWPTVLGALPTEQTRLSVTTALRAAGFTADDFGRSRAARQVVAEGLVAAEDAIESRPGARMAGERAGLRAVRRRLELELWP